MNKKCGFVARFREVLVESGEWKVSDLEDVVGNWQDFVFSCEQGYDEDRFEYGHGLEDRDTLESALNDPVLNGFAETEWLRREVHAADERFRELLHEQPRRDPASSPWWYAYVPRFAGREFAEDMHRMHGLNIRVVE